MRRVLFLTGEASGSLILEAILSGRPGNRESLAKVTFPVSLPVADDCLYLGGDRRVNVIDDLIRARPEVEFNEVYCWEPPAVCSPDLYASLPGDFRFIYLLRDPRNRIESRVTKVVSAGAAKRDDFFRYLCHLQADELNSILGMIYNPRFTILHFESLIAVPVMAMSEAFSFAGLTLDEEAIVPIADEQLSRFATSSFGDRGVGANDRWLSWTMEERQLFDSLCGDALIRLGYERDHSWVDRQPEPVLSVAPTVEPVPVVGEAGGFEELPTQKKSKRGRKKKDS